MREIGIGVLGFGTVGAGAVEILKENADLLSRRIGAELVLRAVADIDIASDRGVSVDSSILTTDAAAVVDDPAVDVVVELIGGTGAARELVCRALKQGKSVVTANKKLLAEYGEELFSLAVESGAELLFEGSVGGGIPIIRSLREGLIANTTIELRGILNGTCNYMLTQMGNEGLSYDEALDEAKQKGYAEADSALDVDGIDSAHKACILASLAYGFHPPFKDISVEGISGLDIRDVRYAANLGYRIKLLAVVRRCDADVEVRVYPALVALDHMLASVSGVFNAVMVKSDFADDTLYYGRGAGSRPTASAVVGDIADAARNILFDSKGRLAPISLSTSPVRLLDPGRSVSRHYIRLSLLDRPGVLSRITGALGECGVSIATVLQQESCDDDSSGNCDCYVPVVVITHNAAESHIMCAIEKIKALSVVGDTPVHLRISD